MAHKKGGKQSLETASEKVQILELADKDFKSAVYVQRSRKIIITSKELKESMRTKSHQIETIDKMIKITKKNKIKI